MLLSPRMPRAPRPRPVVRLRVEPLEDRLTPASLFGTPGFFQQTNLVSDQAGVAALVDPELKGGWGVSLSAGGGAVWVSANTTGVSTL